MRAFEAVGRLGGIRKAAQKLGIHHSAVSRHLLNLERWTGTSLVESVNGKTRLTPAGTVYHGQIAAALNEISQATLELMGHGCENLTVWCSPGLAVQWLAPQLEVFRAVYPAARIELRPTDVSTDHLADSASCEIRYCLTQPDPPPFIRVKLLAQPLLHPVASPDLAQALSVNSAEELLNLPLLHDESIEHWQHWLAAQGVDAPPTLPGGRYWHAHLTLQAAQRGQGVALANMLLLRDELECGRLVSVLPTHGEWQPARGAYYILARESRWHLGIVSAFRRWIELQMLALSQV